MLAIGERPQFLSLQAFSEACLSVLTTWHLAFLRMKDSMEQVGSHNIFSDLSLEGTCCFFYNISLITLGISFHMGGNYTGHI